MDLYQELYKKYGALKRARSCYLYTASGIRISDIYLSGAAAVLGRGGRARNIKNVASRALPAAFNTILNGCLSRATSKYFSAPYDAKILFEQPKDVTVYKPFMKVPSGAFVFPLEIHFTTIYVLCVPKGERFPTCKLPLVSDALGYIAAKEIIALKKFIESHSESDFSLYDDVVTKYWVRKGPYLTPIVRDYDAFALHALNKCLLFINPYGEDSVIPLSENKNIFDLLKKYPYSEQE